MSDWVVKVGGSLFDWPQLGPRLRLWLATLPTDRVLLIPGGGRCADVVRDLDRAHGLGDETAHWLALRSLSLTAHFLAALLPGAAVIDDLRDAAACWQRGRPPVLDCYSFAAGDERRPGRLPHTWDVTSDSLAARVAQILPAQRLVLLKSASVPDEIDWQEAARLGLVDPCLPAALGPGFAVEVINFREWSA